MDLCYFLNTFYNFYVFLPSEHPYLKNKYLYTPFDQNLLVDEEVLNIDPHADFRAEEGRHSGNGFRYAYNQSYMNKYGVWGLHENYNNQTILDSFTNNKNLFYQSLDYIIRKKDRDFKSFLAHFSDELGIELDLDSIKNMPSSAMSPLGFTEEEVLEFLLQVSSSKKVLYYHLAEGSPQMESTYKVGKFLTYAVTAILYRI